MTTDFGVYVHIPFCASRCDYCDFATWTDRAHLIDSYVDACVRDVEVRRLPDASSVFFGGGTPSLLPADALVRILDAIPRTRGAEVTVECNPDSVDPGKLGTYARSGVNRLSFGVQSMRAHVLAELGRTHDPANVERAVGWAGDAGIARVNVDLIYGAAGERRADWEATLDAALALGPTHLSAYALTVEPGTPLGQAVSAGTRSAPDDDDQAQKYELADARLAAAGFDWYEISNWARPGDECRQHLLYWEQGEYVGIGSAAHGHTDATRWWNVRTPERYIAAITAGASPEAGHERLDPAGRAEERFALGLRTRAGAVLPTDQAGVVACADELRAAGLLEPAADLRIPARAVLTRRGRLLGNEVTARLLVAMDATGRAGAGTR